MAGGDRRNNLDDFVFKEGNVVVVAGEGKWRRELASVPGVSVPSEDGSVFKKTGKDLQNVRKQLKPSFNGLALREGVLWSSCDQRESDKGLKVSRGGPTQAAAGRKGSRGPARPRNCSQRSGGPPGETHRPTEVWATHQNVGLNPSRQKNIGVSPTEKLRDGRM
eukprot:Gb_03877 [translate_table: standard]